MCLVQLVAVAVGHTRLSRKVMSLRRAKPSVTGDRAGLESALRVIKDIVGVREEGYGCSGKLKGCQW
jgi:hypothetical protein